MDDPRSGESSVLVLGSANIDIAVEVAEIPLPGQTILARRSRRSPGGKGANQAVAAARFGVRTALVACLGADADGALLRQLLAQSEVDVSLLQLGMQPTGLALVLVAESGENSIVVLPGANAELKPRATEPEPMSTTQFAAHHRSVFLAQLEVPLSTVTSEARRARTAGAKIVLNAAPFQQLPSELYALIDLLVVNEQESLDAAAQFGPTDDVMATLLKAVPEVIITYGAAGSEYANADGARHSMPAMAVPALDTTAAGDTYCGVMAAAIAAGEAIEEAMRLATAASALCVQSPGAIDSIPSRDEIYAFLNTHPAG